MLLVKNKVEKLGVWKAIQLHSHREGKYQQVLGKLPQLSLGRL